MMGAIFVIAKTRTCVVCTNEGNADLSANVPKLQIASIGVETIISRLEHLAVCIRLLSRSALGRRSRSTGTRLIDAAKAQSEFEFGGVVGTLVGLWSPGFSSAFSVPGYHLHFLSEDRTHGGHLLACSGGALHLRMETLTDFHLARPESEAFLKNSLINSFTQNGPISTESRMGNK
jgi:Alpha-acetolactate decarboxylase/LUD domain